MVRSKFLSAMSEEERKKLIEKLHKKQNGKCFICEERIDPSIRDIDLDNIIPLNAGGKDVENNIALTNSTCNRKKQDSNLEVARLIHHFERIRENSINKEGKSPDLSDMLSYYDGSKYEFRFNIDGNKIKYSFSEIEDEKIYESVIYTDHVSKVKSFIAEIPIEYIFHDEKGLNPRKLTNNVIKLIKEFYQKRPQLHIGLSRINYNNENKAKIFIFDGQHKAAAQMLLGNRKLLLRIFLNPELELLAITNERAGTVLRQLAFDKSVQRQLGSTILSWKIERFQLDKGLSPDDYSFSEKDLISHFRGGVREVKKFILDFVRRKVIEDPENELVDYINFGGREKEKPLSYSSIEKTFYSLFILNDALDIRPFFNNRRENEIKQLVKLMNIIVEELLKDKYDFNIGVFKMEERVRKIKEGKSNETIPDDHLRAYRLMKEEILYNWLKIMKQIIQMYFTIQGKIVEEQTLFQESFDEQLWNNVRNFLRNLYDLPIWSDRDRTHIFSKKEYAYWHEIFKTGKSPDGIIVLNEGLNVAEMIKR